MIIIYSLVPTVEKIIHSLNLTQITWGKKWNRLKGRDWPLKEESRLCSNLNWYHLTWNGCHPTTFNLLPVLIKQTREPLVVSLVVSLVALKQHGNHGCTPRDWPLQRKWKSQRKDKIPWANKEVILPNLLLKTSWDKTLVLCWGYWVSIQCRVERQRMLSWLISGKQMQCQKELKVVDSVQTQICPHGVPERKGPQQH